MRKNIFGVLLMQVYFLCSMETGNKENISIFRHPSLPVVVIQDDIYNRYTPNADLTIVGETEQIEQLKNTELYPTPLVGSMHLDCKTIMRRNKIFTKYFDPSYEGNSKDSAAIIVDGERFIITNPQKHVEKIKMDNRFLVVREPQVWCKPLKDDLSLDDRYVYMRECKGKDAHLEAHTYKGSEAIIEAVNDLRCCYKSILMFAHESFSKEHKTRSIAFSQLSISLGIPEYRAAHVAVAAVIEFINENCHKNKYEVIEFVVPRLEDFNTYKNILSEYKIDAETGMISY